VGSVRRDGRGFEESMSQQLALSICSAVVVVLYYLNRDRTTRNSRALWVPVIWIGLLGSRPASMWFGIAPPNGPDANLEGSPVDAAMFGTLLAIGLIILALRKEKTGRSLSAITPVLIYSIYCLLSVTWSPVPVPSFKRWIKDLGDVVMVLIIMTDPQPVRALRRLYFRVGSILFPFSIALIRYTRLGRAWNNDGLLTNVGVTTDKNMLGVIVFVISLGILWNVRWLFLNKSEPGRNRRLFAEGVLLTFGVYLLSIAHSSTSLACFLLGSGLMLATYMGVIRRRPSRVYLAGLAVFVLGGLAIAVGGAGDVANALGRDASFSGRTVIWAALIPTVTNPVMGTGFESYWNSPNQEMFADTLNSGGWYHAEFLNEAHNGYLEVYLNLGWVGLSLMIVILTTGYSRACKAFRHDRELGSLTLAYIVTGMIYAITEAAFRTLGAMWMFILIAVIAASCAKAGLFAVQSTNRRALRAA
jgi:exopolysaccharide production protein ExoQ